ncbi:MAG: hypothetical protein M3081_01185 [Gemmatimonadota bacterium]|nr:hypothetical protein [Gemmatimonadota bacterium]
MMPAAAAPVFGASIRSVDSRAARAVPGVRRVVQLDPGSLDARVNLINHSVAVLVDNTWAAMKGRAALRITWNEGEGVEVLRAQSRFAALAPNS